MHISHYLEKEETLLNRYEAVSRYMNNQTDEQWEKLKEFINK